MVDKTEEEFSAMENSVSGDIYIGGGETQAMRPIAGIMREIMRLYPGIRFHLHSGNAQDVTERVDKGLLDFGILIQPADISKYDFINLPFKDVWGVLMRKDCSLAHKESVERMIFSNFRLYVQVRLFRLITVKTALQTGFREISKN